MVSTIRLTTPKGGRALIGIGGRDQIGIPGGNSSEWVGGIVGIRTLLAALRDPGIFARLPRLYRPIELALDRAPKSGDAGAREASVAVVGLLRDLEAQPPEPFPLDVAIDLVKKAFELANSWHHSLTEAKPVSVPTPDLAAVSKLIAALRQATLSFRSEFWRFLDCRGLLIKGNAGTGKSHLLADVCEHQIESDRPAIMLLGGRLPDAGPWGAILTELDLPRHLQVRQFLGALNAAGEAAGIRSLVAIDAINEKRGQDIWPHHMPGFLSDTDEFPWITVAFSCRTIYEDSVVPPVLDNSKLPRVEHDGFDDDEVLAYLRKKGISVPETPRQLDELGNPLFLRLACDALNASGEVLLPDGLGGISDVFELVEAGVIQRVNNSLGTSPRRGLVAKAIAAIAQEMAETGRGEIGFDRADELVRAIHDGAENAHDLLFQLENEGLLAVEQDRYSREGSQQVVHFMFERQGDHAIVADLLKRSSPSGDANALRQPGSPLDNALRSEDSYILSGLFAALAIQLPEKFDLELPDLGDVSDHPAANHAFLESLLSRRTKALTSRTWELITEIGGEALRMDTLIALSTDPDNDHNVLALDAKLRLVAMPERDAVWSTYLTESDRAMSLVDWAWKADQWRIADARAELAAIQLTWFFTTTLRPLRDRATKALVSLIVERANLGLRLWDRFKGVDDPYVVERVLAALYGAGLQGRWSDAELSAVADRIYQDLFAGGAPTANALMRDHARGLLAYAIHRGAAPSAVTPASISGPFYSAWPIEHVPDEVVEGFTRTYRAGGLHTDEIVGSCTDGDFGSYVIPHSVDDWSAAPIGTASLPDALELHDAWLKRFSSVATPEMVDAYDTLMAVISAESPEGRASWGEAERKIRDAKAAFLQAIGSELFEEWRETAEHWRSDASYQDFARGRPASFNIGWARRWVVKRAHDLGWDEQLHGEFDLGIRGNRNEHRLERIGKKYQWLALYELVARLNDNLALLPDTDGDRIRLRNLDPSLLIEATRNGEEEDVQTDPYWIGPAPDIYLTTPREALAWLHSSDDVLDGEGVIAVHSPDDGRDWLVLSGFASHRSPNSALPCETWRRVGCIVVRGADRDPVLNVLKAGHLLGNTDLPSAEGGGYHVHLGEFPWATTDETHDDWREDWLPFGHVWRSHKGVDILPTTCEYHAESDGYDHSISKSINLHLPARWLMEGLDLRLSDGASLLFQDPDGITRFKDPSTVSPGQSAALIDRTAFLDLLAKKGLVAVWSVGGEKNAYGPSRRGQFGGRFTFTQLYYSDGQDLRTGPRLETLDKPSVSQKAAFLGGTFSMAEEED